MRLLLAVSFALLHCVHGANDDLFNYRETDGNDYGPEDWDQVTCDDLEQCVSATMYLVYRKMDHFHSQHHLNLYACRLGGQMIGSWVWDGNSKIMIASGVQKGLIDAAYTISHRSI